MKYFLTVDIGGTTFNSGLFNESLEKIEITQKDKIRYYNGKEEVVSAIINQILTLINNNNLNHKDIIALGIAAPGPLDIQRGIILDTVNLKIFQNYNISEDFKGKLNINTYIQNDANLFAYGEWYENYKDLNNFIGVTIGTGFGLGFISNGNIFLGAHCMAMEYGLSPFKWGHCEDNISIRYIRELSKKVYGEELSPRIIEKKYYKNDTKAISIYNDFGRNLGLALSHIINLIDPHVISIGGGLSNAFECFEKEMLIAIRENSPSYSYNKIKIYPSSTKEVSTMIGACLYANTRNKENID